MNRLAPAFASLWLCVLPSVAGVTTDPKMIEGLAKAGKIDEAIDAGRAAVKDAPDDPDLRLVLAKALATKARTMERVIEVPGKATELKEVHLTTTDFANAKIGVRYDAAMFEEALLHLSEGIKRAPARKDLRMMQCFLLTDGARLDRAAAALRSAMKALPKSEGLDEELAKFGAERTRRGDPAGGAELLGVVAQGFPSSAQVQSDWGMSLARVGRAAESRAALDRATKLAPRDLRYMRAKATAAMLSRDFPTAKAGYDAAWAESRQDEDRFGSAAALYGIDRAKAREAFVDLGTPSPSAPQVMTDLAGDFAAACAQDPASETALKIAANIVARQQEILALPILDQAMKAAPANAAIKKSLADAYRALGAPVLAEKVEKGKPAK